MNDKQWIKFIHSYQTDAGYLIPFMSLGEFLAQERPKKNQVRRVSDDAFVTELKNNTAFNHIDDDAFVTELKNNTAFKHIDIDNELSKMDAWLLGNPQRIKSRKFIVNWLNKQQAPVKLTENKKIETKYTKPVLIFPRCRYCNCELSKSQLESHELVCQKEKQINA